MDWISELMNYFKMEEPKKGLPDNYDDYISKVFGKDEDDETENRQSE